ncbi:MAG TPA: endonuclease/exonuclease/phosphatase family protein, partial [Gammaproteobacteria bacterium]
MHHGTVSPAIAKGLKALRARIDAAGIPSSKLDESINIATWNIREFGKVKRTEAAVHYIAEILGQFDLISLVELRDNLSDLRRVLDILGPYWRAVYSDALYDAGGNRERIGFIYDKRAVTFTGFAAAANPPRRKVKNEYKPEFTWWRQPYMASFNAGSFDFIVLATHLQWGTVQGRNKELAALAEWIDLKRKEKTCEDKDMIVVGDFNIETPAQLELLTEYGLELPAALRGKEFGT